MVAACGVDAAELGEDVPGGATPTTGVSEEVEPTVDHLDVVAGSGAALFERGSFRVRLSIRHWEEDLRGDCAVFPGDATMSVDLDARLFAFDVNGGGPAEVVVTDDAIHVHTDLVDRLEAPTEWISFPMAEDRALDELWDATGLPLSANFWADTRWIDPTTDLRDGSEDVVRITRGPETSVRGGRATRYDVELDWGTGDDVPTYDVLVDDDGVLRRWALRFRYRDDDGTLLYGSVAELEAEFWAIGEPVEVEEPDPALVTPAEELDPGALQGLCATGT